MAFLKFCDRIVWLAILVIIAAFFLPWVRLEADLLRPLTQAQNAGWGEAFGKLRDRIKQETKSLEQSSGYRIRTEGKIQASGFDIPRLINTDNTQLALAFAEIVTKKTKGAEWKSYGVYTVPGLALLLGLLYQFTRGPRWGTIRKFPLLVCLIATAVFLGGLYKLTHTSLDHMVVQAQIGFGLWISLFGYCAIAVATFLGTVTLLFIRNKK